MTWAMSEEIIGIFRRAAKESLVTLAERGGGPILDREAVKAVLPHRDPFLFIDQVTVLDLEKALIVGRYSLSRAQDVFAGHFPGYPVWPAVLQIEAIMQAGVILFAARAGTSGLVRATVIHVNGARFMRPIVPGDDVEILAHVIEDSLLYTVVGQCLQDGSICSVVAADLLVEGSES